MISNWKQEIFAYTSGFVVGITGPANEITINSPLCRAWNANKKRKNKLKFFFRSLNLLRFIFSVLQMQFFFFRRVTARVKRSRLTLNLFVTAHRASQYTSVSEWAYRYGWRACAQCSVRCAVKSHISTIKDWWRAMCIIKKIEWTMNGRSLSSLLHFLRSGSGSMRR